MTAFALGGVTVSSWGPRLPELRAELGLDNAALGVVLAGLTVGSVAGLGASAAVLSWLGSRRAICAGLWWTGVAIAVIGLGAGAAGSVAVTTVGFVMVGFGIGAVDVMINVEGAAVERAAGRTLLPLMHAAWSAGAIVGAGIGAGCAALSVGVQWQFLGEAVLIVVAAGVAASFIPAHGAPDIPVSSPTPQVSRVPRARRVRDWLRGWGDWRLLLIGMVMLGVELGEGTANNWLTLAVRDGHQQADSVAPLFFVAFAVSETIARIAGGPLVDRVGRVAAVRMTTAVGVVGMVIFILGGPAWAILLGTLLWAVGVSMGFPLGMSAAADSGPNPAARVSVVASIGYLANLAGPPVIGFMSEAIGLLHALWLVVALLVLGFAASGALKVRPDRQGTSGSMPQDD